MKLKSTPEAPVVDEHGAEETRETDVCDRIADGYLEATLEDRDRLRSLAECGVRTRDALDERRMLLGIVTDESDCLLEKTDRERGITALESDLSQPVECSRALLITAGMLERLLEEMPSLLRLVQAQGELGLIEL